MCGASDNRAAHRSLTLSRQRARELDREGIGGEGEASLRGDPSEGIRKKERRSEKDRDSSLRSRMTPEKEGGEKEHSDSVPTVLTGTKSRIFI